MMQSVIEGCDRVGGRQGVHGRLRAARAPDKPYTELVRAIDIQTGAIFLDLPQARRAASQFGGLDGDGACPSVLRGEPQLLHGCGRGEPQSPVGVSGQQNVAGFAPSPSRWAPASWRSRYRNSRPCPWPVGSRTEGLWTVGGGLPHLRSLW